ncbi:MAG: urease accessory protein [Saprospiraceae bacterium]|nr:urease accessory protein [Saprospiraceae bacterium]
MEHTVPLVFAAAMGFSHAFEADHLLAVSTIVTRRNSVWLAVKDGIAWGLGHSSTIFLIGMLLLLGKVAISEQIFHYLEAVVGGMLMVLGLLRLRFLFRPGGGAPVHAHLREVLFFRKKGLAAPAWVLQRPVGARPPAIENLRLAAPADDHRLAYAVGLVHGLAGSGALVLLVMSRISGLGGAVSYLLIFGLGSIAGMLLASGVFSLPFSKKVSANPRLQTGLSLLSSLLCVGYGAQVVFENLISGVR